VEDDLLLLMMMEAEYEWVHDQESREEKTQTETSFGWCQQVGEDSHNAQVCTSFGGPDWQDRSDYN
jgi:hypothetical protein